MKNPMEFFSNLYRRPLVFDGIEFPTAEHAYQAGKARKKEVTGLANEAPTPSLLAMAAHGLNTWDIVPDWSLTKYDRMRKVVYAKFSQHEDLKQLLLNTGDARLVETGTVSNGVNKTWGEVNGKGLNMLGRRIDGSPSTTPDGSEITTTTPHAPARTDVGPCASALVLAAMSTNQYDSELAELQNTYADGLRADISRLKAAIAGASELSVLAVGSEAPLLLPRSSARFTKPTPDAYRVPRRRSKSSAIRHSRRPAQPFSYLRRAKILTSSKRYNGRGSTAPGRFRSSPIEKQARS